MKNRKQNRLKNYDYSQNGMYFVTICTRDREHYFGKIIDGKMNLSKIGFAAKECWLEIPEHFPHISLDEFVIMPNHIHGIIEVVNVGGKNFCSLPALSWQTEWSRSLSSVMRGFKIGVTKWCNGNNCEYFSWQRNYYDHIIRNEKSLAKIREYIRINPVIWERDRNNDVENVWM